VTNNIYHRLQFISIQFIQLNTRLKLRTFVIVIIIMKFISDNKEERIEPTQTRTRPILGYKNYILQPMKFDNV